MVYNNKIEAIKAVRAIGSNVTLTRAEDGRVYLNPSNLGLKDAKDLVEAIMELGAKYSLDEGLAQLARLQTEQDARRLALAENRLRDEVRF